MPATSRTQMRFAQMCEHADHPPEKCPKRGAMKHFTRMTKGRKGTLLKGEHR